MRRGEYPNDWDERRRRVLERDGYKCQNCGAADSELHVHHVTPISKGGSHKLSNLVAICRSCHAAEHPAKVEINKALANNQRLRMKYSSSTGTRVRDLDPYGIAMHEGIQYLVGHDHYRDEIRVFRPSRIKWAERQTQSFFPPEDWSTEEYLEENLKSRGGGDSLIVKFLRQVFG